MSANSAVVREGGKGRKKEINTSELWLVVAAQRRRSQKVAVTPVAPPVSVCFSQQFRPPGHLLAAAGLWWLESPSD